jgi:enhancing lycopene biosynthesis protein 2
MTIGSNAESSPYDINSFSAGLKVTGVQVDMKTITEIEIDKKNKIISAPCYMMDASLLEVRQNIAMAIEALINLID